MSVDSCNIESEKEKNKNLTMRMGPSFLNFLIDKHLLTKDSNDSVQFWWWIQCF